MWRDKEIKNLLDCLNNEPVDETYPLEVHSLFSCTTYHQEIVDAISKLNSTKSNGPDTIEAEHFKFCNLVINVMLFLAFCFTFRFVYRFLHINMQSDIIILIIKAKSKNTDDKSN